MSYFVIGLDLGQSVDYTALCVIERQPNDEYHCRHLERFKLVPYTDIVSRVAELASTEQIRTSCSLVVDKTGVGAPVVDMLHRAGMLPVSVVITGGNSASKAGAREWHVPKRDLVSSVQVLLESGRLKFAADMLLASVLVQELLSFTVRINEATAHDSYAAWREGVHDDLVLSVALACWYAERRGRCSAMFVHAMPNILIREGGL